MRCLTYIPFLQLENYIDLIIPRGSNDLVRNITEQSKGIPVLGHADGVCHVYLDKDADLKTAVDIIVDAKTDYPAACNAMETLLVHKDLLETPMFTEVSRQLKEKGVKINLGPELFKLIGMGGEAQTDYHVEYGEPECTIEIVEDMQHAIDVCVTSLVDCSCFSNAYL